jgi:formyl-CoA transferase
MDRLGLGYDAMHLLNPRLVYCSITGFGPSGPSKDWPGYDTIGVAMGGLLSLITEIDAPQPAGYAFSDHFAGMFAAQGILAALVSRSQSGRGQHVRTSLLEVTVAAIGENAARYFHDGIIPGRADRTHLAQVYACVDCDGRPFLVHLSSPLKFWEGLLTAINRQQWRDDLRFRTRADRMKNYDALHSELSAIFLTDRRDYWLSILRKNDVPAGPLYTLEEVFDDPQVRHLGLKQRVPHPAQGHIELVAPGLQMSETPVAIRSTAPLLGEHTQSLLG